MMQGIPRFRGGMWHGAPKSEGPRGTGEAKGVDMSDSVVTGLWALASAIVLAVIGPFVRSWHERWLERRRRRRTMVAGLEKMILRALVASEMLCNQDLQTQYSQRCVDTMAHIVADAAEAGRIKSPPGLEQVVGALAAWAGHALSLNRLAGMGEDPGSPLRGMLHSLVDGLLKTVKQVEGKPPTEWVGLARDLPLR
jgi:hypothetical protein